MDEDMNQFVTHGASKITPRELEEVVRAIPTLRAEWTAQVDHEAFPKLAEQLDFLARLVEDFEAGLEKDLPYEAVSEAAFALVYFHREIDIIPDFIPGIGYADDAAVVETVLNRNDAVFTHYAEEKRIDLPPEGDLK